MRNNSQEKLSKTEIDQLKHDFINSLLGLKFDLDGLLIRFKELCDKYQELCK